MARKTPPPNWSRTRPLTPQQSADWRREIEQLGPLSEQQAKAFQFYFNAQDKPLKLKQMLNLAGAAPERTKSACELLAEKTAGVANLQLKVKSGIDLLLNETQEQTLEQAFYDSSLAPAGVAESLTAAGPLNAEQSAAIESFYKSQPTLGQRNHDVCFELLKAGPMSVKQREFLLKDYAEEMAWRTEVGKLFVVVHDTKYAWSGAYDEAGTPFGWLYEYAMQPLMTTMFALLAFFVASAAFRAFRAKNIDAILLLGTAFIILLRATPVGTWLSGILPEQLEFLKLDNVYRFIMSVFNTAGNRAIMIGIALGIASTSLKVLLGIDRSYLGSDD